MDEGIALLTGVPAGERDADGRYPPDSVNGRVDHKLFDLADRLSKFGQRDKDNGRNKEHKDEEGEPGEEPDEPPAPPEPGLPGEAQSV